MATRSSNKQKEKMIRDLKRENRRLKKENEYLKHLSMQYDEIPKDEESPEQKMLSGAVKQTYALGAKNYFSYLLQRLRASRTSSPFRHRFQPSCFYPNERLHQ